MRPSLLDTVLLARADQQIADTPSAIHCERCGRRTSAEHGVCSKCADGKAAYRAEEDAATRLREEREAATAADLAELGRRLAESERPPPTPTQEPKMSDAAVEEKLCPHCGKKLRSDNRRGACTKCLAKGRSPAVTVVAEPDGPAAKTVERFRMAAEGLGMDPDEILEEFCSDWLAKARKGVS